MNRELDVRRRGSQRGVELSGEAAEQEDRFKQSDLIDNKRSILLAIAVNVESPR